MIEKENLQNINMQQTINTNILDQSIQINQNVMKSVEDMKDVKSKTTRSRQADQHRQETKTEKIDVRGLYDRIEIPGERLDEQGKYDYRTFHRVIVRDSFLSDTQITKRTEDARKRAQLGKRISDADREAGAEYEEKYGGEKRLSKGDMFETIMNAEISNMTYSSDDEFCEKYAQNYESLRMAGEYLDRASEADLASMSDNEMAKLLFMKSVKADYDSRMELMSSNYYALLTKKDIEQIVKMGDAAWSEVLGKKNSAELKKYLALHDSVTSTDKLFGERVSPRQAFGACREYLKKTDQKQGIKALKSTPEDRVAGEIDRYSSELFKELEDVSVEAPGENETFENEVLAQRQRTLDGQKLKISDDLTKITEEIRQQRQPAWYNLFSDESGAAYGEKTAKSREADETNRSDVKASILIENILGLKNEQTQ